MPAPSTIKELLTYIEPFRVGGGRQPDFGGMNHLQTLVRNLTEDNPAPDLGTALPQLAGLWRCLFTSSRFVLGLNRIRVAQLSAVYQRVVIDAGGKSGHYFNIGEMSRKGRVRGACGEYAAIQPSSTESDRLDVQYQWFYVAFRIWSSYEGTQCLADRLEAGRVPRQLRMPFHKTGWQRNAYVDDELRIVVGSEGGIFVLVREAQTGSGSGQLVRGTLDT